MAHWRDHAATAPPWQWGAGAGIVVTLAVGLSAPLTPDRLRWAARRSPWLYSAFFRTLGFLYTSFSARYQRSRLDRMERAVVIQLEGLHQNQLPQAP